MPIRTMNKMPLGGAMGSTGGGTTFMTATECSGLGGTVYTVTNLNDAGAGSYRDAIENLLSNDGDIICFDPTLRGQTLTLLSNIAPNAFNVFIYFNGVHVTGSSPLYFGSGVYNGKVAQAFGGYFFNISTGACLVNSANMSLFLKYCTFKGNSITTRGGAIQMGSSTGMTLDIENCTFAENSANTQGGGAIRSNGTTNINSSTFINNSCTNANEGGAVKHDGGGVWTNKNCLYWNNLAAAVANDMRGAWTSGGFNNFQNSFNAPTGDTLTNISGDPTVGGIQDNGGLTPTFALQSGSNCIDAGGGDSTIDQRGVPRPAGAMDIGAYEKE